jgi:molybdate transport system ATP-binding protein
LPPTNPKSKKRPFLWLRDATFRLGERLVFEDTCWVFQRHEHWAVLGPNGAGKSLFSQALRGRLPVVRGELRYQFRPLSGVTPEDAIGHVSFEERKSEIHETVVQSRWNSIEEQNVLRLRDFLSYVRVLEINPFEVTAHDHDARAHFAVRRRRAIQLLQIETFLDRTLLSLSNGEWQKAQLARALCHPMRLLILDEPFSGLDAANRARFGRILERLMATSLRVLLLTTRDEDLPRQITHVLNLQQCKVVAMGPRTRTPVRAGVRAHREVRKAGRIHSEYERVDAPNPVPAQDNELVSLRSVTVRYGAATILNEINWTVRVGESWALLGPNGSGKTTLLSLILGDNPQVYQNHVEVFSRRRGTGESIWELKRRIGWVSPELHLHFMDSLTCFETVGSGFHETIGLFEPLTPAQRAATRHWLSRFQLSREAQTSLGALSAGVQRMVLLARALVKSPRLLILDEPCQGLDRSHRDLFLNTVDKLIRTGLVTAIYVTHREEEIPPSISRVLRLSNGSTSGPSRPRISSSRLPGRRSLRRKSR